jgi:hypothetical protein
MTVAEHGIGILAIAVVQQQAILAEMCAACDMYAAAHAHVGCRAEVQSAVDGLREFHPLCSETAVRGSGNSAASCNMKLEV